jgi:hypothetical protein
LIFGVRRLAAAFWVAFAAIVIIAAFLRLHEITTYSLNNDEIVEVRWSSESLPKLFDHLWHDRVHPPFDYLVQWTIGRFDPPEWVRRIPPITAGILTVAFLMLLGRWWYSPLAGLAAGFFIAISPFHVRYSQEVRPYALGICFMVASFIALELYSRTVERRWFIAWFALVFLAGATLYLAGVVAAVGSIARIVFDWDGPLRTVRRRFPLIVVAWAVLYSPWLGVVFAATKTAPMPPERLEWTWWFHRLSAFGTGNEVYEPMSPGSWMFWGMVVVGLIACIRKPSAWPAAAWLLIGGAVTIVILQLRPHYAHVARYVMAPMTAAPLIAGFGFAFFWRWAPPRIAVSIATLAYAGFSLVTLTNYYDHGRPDWRTLVEFVHQRAKPGETVFLTNDWVVRNFGYYWLKLPRRTDVIVERYFRQHREFTGPAWIVAAHCRPREPMADVTPMWKHPPTDHADIRYVRPGQRLSLINELCPE